jgi:hypothetical protein
MLQNLEAHYVDDANQQRLCLDRAGLLIERHTPQGQTPALTSQDTTAILSNRMTVTADMIYSLDRATDLGLAALAHCVGKDPATLYQAIDLIGCRYTAQDKKLCQLTDAQLVGAIQFTPTEMEAYSRDHSGFAGPMPGIWQLWTAIRFPATRRNQRFQRRLISSKPPRRTGQSNLT